MVGVRFVPYTAGDSYRVRVRAGDALGGNLADNDELAWTMMEGDEVLACGGIFTIEKGIGFLWAYISDEAKGHGRSLIMHSRRMVAGAVKNGCFRVQAVVRADKPEYERFIELVGLSKEGLMRKATPERNDLFMYAKISEV